MKTEDWAIAASDWVDGIEAEHKRDPIDFVLKNDGSARAKSAIAKLDALKMRLQKFVHA